MYDVYSCGLDGVIVRPKRVQTQNILIYAKDPARLIPPAGGGGEDGWFEL